MSQVQHSCSCGLATMDRENFRREWGKTHKTPIAMW